MNFNRLWTVLCALIGSTVVASDTMTAKILTDKTFEHDTQATFGHTTGDWLVLFCDDRKSACREMYYLWDELAGTLYGKLSVAKINS